MQIIVSSAAWRGACIGQRSHPWAWFWMEFTQRAAPRQAGRKQDAAQRAGGRSTGIRYHEGLVNKLSDMMLPTANKQKPCRLPLLAVTSTKHPRHNFVSFLCLMVVISCKAAQDVTFSLQKAHVVSMPPNNKQLCAAAISGARLG